MDQLNFHEMALEELENMKEYLLTSKSQQETYSERGEINQQVLLINRAIQDKKQQLLNG